MTNPALLTKAVSGGLLQHCGSASIHNNGVESNFRGGTEVRES